MNNSRINFDEFNFKNKRFLFWVLHSGNSVIFKRTHNIQGGKKYEYFENIIWDMCNAVPWKMFIVW